MSESKIIVVTHDNFEALIQDNTMVFIDFWASWCVPCQNFGEIYARVAASCQQITFGTINIEQETLLAETFNIRSVPHLIIFKQGIAIYSEAGSMPESTLLELVEQTLLADLSQILQG